MGDLHPLPPCIAVINIIVRFDIDNHVRVMAHRMNDYKGESTAKIKIKDPKFSKLRVKDQAITQELYIIGPKEF